MFKTGVIPADKKRGWTVTIDGEEKTVGKLSLSSRWGVLDYGLRPEGYDSWTFREANGGGVVTIPWTRDPKAGILIGLVAENRQNISDKPVLCAIGGFIDPNESAEKAQGREAGEEAGMDTAKARRLEGVSFAADRLFFVTEPDEGVKVWGLEIPFSWLEGTGLKPEHIITKNPESKVVFMPWKFAVRETPDGIALAAIAQLLSHIL